MVGELFDKKKEPPSYRYRMKYYKDTEEYGEKIINGQSAIIFLLRFNIAYYFTGNVDEIFNYDILVKFEQIALKILEKQELKFGSKPFLQRHSKWLQKSRRLVELESEVLNNNFPLKEYMELLKDYNGKVDELNEDYMKIYNLNMGFHSTYWVQNNLLRSKIREELNIPKSKVVGIHRKEKAIIDNWDKLVLYGILEVSDYR